MDAGRLDGVAARDAYSDSLLAAKYADFVDHHGGPGRGYSLLYSMGSGSVEGSNSLDRRFVDATENL